MGRSDVTFCQAPKSKQIKKKQTIKSTPGIFFPLKTISSNKSKPLNLLLSLQGKKRIFAGG
jgi:hypothetical protein